MVIQSRDEFRKIESCRLCGAKDLKQFINFGDVPLGNNLFDNEKEALTARQYPLSVQQCQNCNHFQLTTSVSPQVLYATNYTYLSNVGKSFVRHISSYVKWIKERTNIKKNNLIVDIGSNDGTCLGEFKKHEFQVCGVDPAFLPSKIANKKGIYTINKFFNENVVREIINEFGYADLITSQNVLAHIEDLEATFINIYDLLKQDGFFCFEIGYFGKVLENGLFDTIYHEHLDYHHSFPLVNHLSKIGFEICNLSLNNVQGGSLRVLARKNKAYLISKQAQDFLSRERKTLIYKNSFLENWENKIKVNLVNFSNKVVNYYNKGYKVIAYGAPTKAVLLLKSAKIPKKIISCIIEDNLYKVDKYIPFYGTKIISLNNVKFNEKTVIIILAWNFSDDILKKLRKMGFKNTKIIVPLPKVKEINL